MQANETPSSFFLKLKLDKDEVKEYRFSLQAHSRKIPIRNENRQRRNRKRLTSTLRFKSYLVILLEIWRCT